MTFSFLPTVAAISVINIHHWDGCHANGLQFNIEIIAAVPHS
jgi:hypothetical protein